MRVWLTLSCAFLTGVAAPLGEAAAFGQPSTIPLGNHLEYYKVSGTTLEDLYASLNNEGPIGARGLKVYGTTEWAIDWAFQPWKRESGCQLVHVSTSLRMKITLPKWVDEGTAPLEVVEHWSKFFAVLQEHENGHAQNAEAAAQAELERLSPKATCGTLMREADHVARDTLRRYHAQDREYDRDTQHGQVQLREALASRDQGAAPSNMGMKPDAE